MLKRLHVKGYKSLVDDGSKDTARRVAGVRERNLRYRVEVEMLPRTGILRVADEYLAALNSRGQPTGKRKPFIERHDGRGLHLRHEGQAHPTYYARYLDHTILSQPHYPPHCPHLIAARCELERWLFFYFEPRERMRAANPVKEVRHIGLMGEELVAFLNTLKAVHPGQFQAVEKALRSLLPNIDGIELDVTDLGEVDSASSKAASSCPRACCRRARCGCSGCWRWPARKRPRWSDSRSRKTACTRAASS